MARPKGSKDTKPRKPRFDTAERIAQTRGSVLPNGRTNPEAPFGYSTKGIPLAGPRKPPKSQAGKEAILRAAREKGLIATSAPKSMPKESDAGGRPEKYVDPEQVKQMALIGCTHEEIGSIIGLGIDAVGRRFGDLIAEHRDKGKMSLRRLQLRIAQGKPGKVRVIQDNGTERVEEVEQGSPPNAQMAIHLGKHWLGQKDAGPTNNILVANGQQAGPQGPGPYMPNILSPETADILARKFMEICPDPALVKMTVILDPRNEVQNVQ